MARGGVEDRGIHARHHGQAEAAGDDRGVRAGAAGNRNGAGQPGVGQPDEVGRVDLTADQDEVPVRRRDGRARGQLGYDRLTDLAHVVGPGGQVLARQRGQDGGLFVGRADHRGDRAGAVLHRGGRRIDQSRVARHQAADLHDRGLFGPVVGAELGRQREPFRGHGRERGPDRGHRGWSAGRLTGPVRLRLAPGHLRRWPGGVLSRTGWPGPGPAGSAQVELAGGDPFGDHTAPERFARAHEAARMASRRAPRIRADDAAPGSS